MSKIRVILLAILVIAVIFVQACAKEEPNLHESDSTDAPSIYDNFAKCLTEKGAKFYGAYWCPHCNSQKEMFGSSVKYVDYIECSLPNRAGQTKECNQDGIEAYPTWIFADGQKIEGTLSFEQLSQLTGCLQ